MKEERKKEREKERKREHCKPVGLLVFSFLSLTIKR
jgi:hypothetical protein